MDRIIVSRTDSIGDVVLTLPICTWLKQNFPNAQIVFLCKNYTKDIVSCFKPIDEVLSLENLTLMSKKERNNNLKADAILHVFPNRTIAKWAKDAGISQRIGTSHRWFHWFTCNVQVSFTRKNSELHESQLNFELLKPFGLNKIPDFNEILDQSENFIVPENKSSSLENYIILHPFSQGSALEYPLEKYQELAKKLGDKGFNVAITGSEKEKESISGAFDSIENVIDLSGTFTLKELLVFIKNSKALVACSTGPLHLSGVMNGKAIGLFSNRKPIHPGRWRPLGRNSVSLIKTPKCNSCEKGKICDCIQNISVDAILAEIR